MQLRILDLDVLDTSVPETLQPPYVHIMSFSVVVWFGSYNVSVVTPNADIMARIN